MKKTLIALALATLSTASMADVILYGAIKGGVEVVSEHQWVRKDSSYEKNKGTTTSIVDYGSRIGFRGHEQLTDGLQAIWQLESKVNIGGGGSASDDHHVDGGLRNSTFGTRNSYIGLKGDFGTVKAGYQLTPLADVSDKLDQWEYSSEYAGLAHFTRGNVATDRHVALTYETPNMGGFSAKAFVSPSNNQSLSKEERKDREKIDRAVYGVSLSYAQENGFFADLAGVHAKHARYTNIHGKPAKRPYQALAQLGYENDKFLVGAAYQRAYAVDNKDLPMSSGGDKYYDVVNEALISGAFNATEALKLKASAAYGWGMKQGGSKVYGNGKYYQGIIGADYALSKRTILNGQVGYAKFGTKSNNDVNVEHHGYRGGAVSVGMVHKF